MNDKTYTMSGAGSAGTPAGEFLGTTTRRQGCRRSQCQIMGSLRSFLTARTAEA